MERREVTGHLNIRVEYLGVHIILCASVECHYFCCNYGTLIPLAWLGCIVLVKFHDVDRYIIVQNCWGDRRSFEHQCDCSGHSGWGMMELVFSLKNVMYILNELMWMDICIALSSSCDWLWTIYINGKTFFYHFQEKMMHFFYQHLKNFAASTFVQKYVITPNLRIRSAKCNYLENKKT